jgi:PGF-CTERM protein
VAAQETVTMTVTVADTQGNPISSATVTASWDGGSTSGTTAGNGKVFLDAPDGAQVQLTIEHPGYVRNTPRVIGEAAASEYTVEVYRKGRMRVSLRDGDGPLERARVIVNKNGTKVFDGTTDAQGAIDTGPIEFGEYNVFVQKPRYPTTERTVTVNGTVEPSFTIRSASVTVEFTVLDDHFDDPKPVRDATIVINDGASQVTTLENGEATASVPVNTQVNYRIQKAGYRNQTGSFRIQESAKAVNITVRRIPALEISAANDRVVTGETVQVTVRNEYGEPVSGASVSLDGTEVGTTNDQGVYSVRVESAGEHTISTKRGQTGAQTKVTGVEAATDSPTPTAASTPTPTDEIPLPVSTPGFTPVAGLLALVAFALLALRRR